MTQHILDFFNAFNQGDPQAPSKFFAEGRLFKWYSVTDIGDKQWYTAGTPAELAAYLPRRYAQHERLHLHSFHVSGSIPAGGMANFWYILSRTADDLGPELGGPEHLAIGKGAFDCETKKIMVWSMAMQNPSSPASATPE